MKINHVVSNIDEEIAIETIYNIIINELEEINKNSNIFAGKISIFKDKYGSMICARGNAIKGFTSFTSYENETKIKFEAYSKLLEFIAKTVTQSSDKKISFGTIKVNEIIGYVINADVKLKKLHKYNFNICTDNIDVFKENLQVFKNVATEYEDVAVVKKIDKMLTVKKLKKLEKSKFRLMF